MGKIIVSQFMSLDGVVEAPETWHFPFVTEDMGALLGAQIHEASAFLMGRNTYEGFAAYWPSKTNNEDGIADHLNRTPKYVVSSSLEEATWNPSTILGRDGNAAEDIARLKDSVSGIIAVTGSVGLCQFMMEHDLIDEYHLMVHPIVLGRGQKFFKEGQTQKSLQLLDSRRFEGGVMLLVYGPPPAG